MTRTDVAALTNVTSAEFFAAVGPLNVHPSVDIATLRTPGGIRSDWELPNRALVGVSIGSPPNTKFFLAASYVGRTA